MFTILTYPGCKSTCGRMNVGIPWQIILRLKNRIILNVYEKIDYKIIRESRAYLGSTFAVASSIISILLLRSRALARQISCL